MLLEVIPMAMWRGAQMPIVSVVKPEVEKIALEPSPISRDWILEGDPRARAVLLSSSADGTASTFIWDCTAGRFNWYYGVDETIYVLEGGMTIKDAGGTHHLNAGDTIYFPAGVSAEWIVKSYVRKLAFVRTKLPRSLASARRVYQRLKRVVRIGDKAPAGQLGSL
jgi:uncharacterized protein